VQHGCSKSGVDEILLLGLLVCFTEFGSLAETLAYTLLNLLGDYMRLDVLAKILHVRGHAPPNLEHLPL
jgi:hypothetical protein